jgi:two-component system response regulator HydG
VASSDPVAVPAPCLGPEAPGRPRGDVLFVSLEPLAAVERRHILLVLRACGGNQAEAARVLGIARNTLWRKLEAFHRDGSIPAARGTDGC